MALWRRWFVKENCSIKDNTVSDWAVAFLVYGLFW